MNRGRSAPLTVAVRLAGWRVLTTALTGCGSHTSSGSASTTSSSRPIGTPTSTRATTTTSPPSAANDLAPFFSAAVDLDRRLKAAAASANGDISATHISVSKSTLAAIAAADPSGAAAKIPAGLTPAVLLPVLTVQSDLESRYYAFRGFLFAHGPGFPETIPISGEPGRYLMGCLSSGAKPAASFPADLAAAMAAATRAPPAVKVAASSREAADLALWLHLILGENSGCMECGGYRFTTLLPITWGHVAPLEPGMNQWNGHIGGAHGLLFYARYTASKGWTVGVNACGG